MFKIKVDKAQNFKASSHENRFTLIFFIHSFSRLLIVCCVTRTLVGHTPNSPRQCMSTQNVVWIAKKAIIDELKVKSAWSVGESIAGPLHLSRHSWLWELRLKKSPTLAVCRVQSLLAPYTKQKLSSHPTQKHHTTCLYRYDLHSLYFH